MLQRRRYNGDMDAETSANWVEKARQAIASGDVSGLALCLENGLDPNENATVSRRHGRFQAQSLLHFLALSKTPSAGEMARLLMKHGANPLYVKGEAAQQFSHEFLALFFTGNQTVMREVRRAWGGWAGVFSQLEKATHPFEPALPAFVTTWFDADPRTRQWKQVRDEVLPRFAQWHARNSPDSPASKDMVLKLWRHALNSRIRIGEKDFVSDAALEDFNKVMPLRVVMESYPALPPALIGGLYGNHPNFLARTFSGFEPAFWAERSGMLKDVLRFTPPRVIGAVLHGVPDEILSEHMEDLHRAVMRSEEAGSIQVFYRRAHHLIQWEDREMTVAVLRLAACEDRSETVKDCGVRCAVEAGYPLDHSDSLDPGQTLLHLVASWKGADKKFALLKYLVDKGGDLSIQDARGRTPEEWLAYHPQHEEAWAAIKARDYRQVLDKEVPAAPRAASGPRL